MSRHPKKKFATTRNGAHSLAVKRWLASNPSFQDWLERLRRRGLN